MAKYAITLDNQQIWKFFKEEHPSLNPETSVLMFIDIMNKLAQDVNSSLNNTLAQQLVDSMKQLQSQVSVVSDNVARIQADTLTNFSLKLSEFKKEYIDDVKMILTNNVSEKIAPLLREQNTIMLDKTHLLMNDIIPRNNESLSKQIGDSIKVLHSAISEDTNRFLSSSINQKTLDDFITGLDTKFANTLSTSQTFYNSSEQRLDQSLREIKKSTDSNFNSIKEISTNNQQIATSLNTNVSDMLKKMDNTSTKGKVSENIVYNILQTLYPVSQIDYVGTTKETGDIILIRNNKPKILV
jgi:gas vesicle protein